MALSRIISEIKR